MNDLAIWDHRFVFLFWPSSSVFHTLTFDYEGLGERYGNRVVGMGEGPFLDPNSLSKTEDLERKAKIATNTREDVEREAKVCTNGR